MTNSRWVIGDGQSMDITINAWLSGIPLCRWLTMICVESLEGMHVSVLIHLDGRTWDGTWIRSLLGDSLGEWVKAMLISSIGGLDMSGEVFMLPQG